MRSLITYIIPCVLLIISGCIKKEAIPEKAPDASSASMRDLFANNFSYSMLYEAMQKTGTDSLLDDTGNGYTIFAPDNGAFARSGITVDSLRRINTDQLRQIILYHILPGKISSAGIPQTLNYSFATLQKELLYTTTTAVDTNLFINGIAVVKKNITCKNGMIHAMDKLLTPPAASVQDILAANPEYSCLVAGFKKFGLWEDLKTRKPVVVLAPTNEAFAAYNWDLAAINSMNVNEFRKMTFGTYILSPAFFFTHDVLAAPPKGPILQEEVLLLVQRGYTGIDIKVYPYNYRDPEQTSRTIFFGDWVTYEYSNPGKLALNGIVQESSKLNVIPDSARVK